MKIKKIEIKIYKKNEFNIYTKIQYLIFNDRKF
jgi:hypothetical protein